MKMKRLGYRRLGDIYNDTEEVEWVYKLKKDTEGKIIKYKACLVAKDYVQRHGVDYE